MVKVIVEPWHLDVVINIPFLRVALLRQAMCSVAGLDKPTVERLCRGLLSFFACLLYRSYIMVMLGEMEDKLETMIILGLY